MYGPTCLDRLHAEKQYADCSMCCLLARRKGMQVCDVSVQVWLLRLPRAPMERALRKPHEQQLSHERDTHKVPRAHNA